MPERENHPVTKVNWYDAIEFCARLSRHTGRNYRLPTEAEWEYACRARTKTPFHFGFTIQSNIWVDVGGQPGIHDEKIYQKFGEQIGWYEPDKQEWYGNLRFNLQAPKGHLPFVGMMTGGVLDSQSVSYLTQKLLDCQKPTTLKQLKFETVTVNSSGKIIETKAHQNSYYEEPLGKTISPIIMMAIPEGEFMMGSPEDEPGRYDDESPQHQVKVAPFWLAQTPVTNAQWNFIVNLPQEQRKLNPTNNNQEDNYPVTDINWFEAMEFCARLSRYTGRNYRLPSEAEWEYACRARTKTPFHFGATITSELANYKTSKVYADEPKSENKIRSVRAVSVKSFFPNPFGLYDMHGLVFEWCADTWHDNYHNAPSDSQIWDDNVVNFEKTSTVTEENNLSRILRGGSFSTIPAHCRSANRYKVNPDRKDRDFGFRIACYV